MPTNHQYAAMNENQNINERRQHFGRSLRSKIFSIKILLKNILIVFCVIPLV